MKKTIVMGYCKMESDSRRRKAIVTVELKQKPQGLSLSICGEIKGLAYGQCHEEMKELVVEKRQNFDEIIEVWEKYHLNDMRAGTAKQNKAVKEYCKNNPYDYNDVCNYLKEQGIYEDNGYRYGTAWLFEDIPETILDKIFNW